MIRLDGRIDKIELGNLVKLMDDLDFTEEQKYQMYFMTFDDPYFVESFMESCALLPSSHPTVKRYLDMMEDDISTFSSQVYKSFRENAANYPEARRREDGVIERRAKSVIITSQSTKRPAIEDRPAQSSKAKKPIKLNIKRGGK